MDLNFTLTNFLIVVVIAVIIVAPLHLAYAVWRHRRISKPQFLHDCHNCWFLGRDTLDSGSPIDVYYCPQTPTHKGAMVLRYGDAPHECKVERFK